MIVVSQFAELADQDPAQSAFGPLNLRFPGKCVKEGIQIARGSMLKTEG
jgi:hypothetical protein